MKAINKVYWKLRCFWVMIERDLKWIYWHYYKWKHKPKYLITQYWGHYNGDNYPDDYYINGIKVKTVFSNNYSTQTLHFGNEKMDFKDMLIWKDKANYMNVFTTKPNNPHHNFALFMGWRKDTRGNILMPTAP